MSKYNSIIDIISEKYTDMTDVIEIANAFFTEVEKADPNMKPFKKAMTELEKLAYDIDKPEAENIIKEMKPYGQHWSYKEVESLLDENGIRGDVIEWWLTMNMMYNDYYTTAKKYGHENDVEFFVSLSNNFINDVDGKPFKVEKYFLSD